MQFSSHANTHIRTLISASARIAGIARRLRIHLPPDSAAEEARALLVGKVGNGAAAAMFPCLQRDDPHSALLKSLQTRVNDVVRAVRGCYRRANSTSVVDLLKETGLPSVNRLTIRSVAIEAWKALGPLSSGSDNSPLASTFGQPVTFCTRAGDSGVRRMATKFPMNTFVNTATTVWKQHPSLRTAQTIREAKEIATAIAMASPFWWSSFPSIPSNLTLDQLPDLFIYLPIYQFYTD